MCHESRCERGKNDDTISDQVGSERRNVRLTRATESLPAPLLFRSGCLLTISVPIRVCTYSRMRSFHRSMRGGSRQKLETRYTRTWSRGEGWSWWLRLSARMVTLTELHICLWREKVTDRR